MLIVPLRDLSPGGEPDIVVRADVLQREVEVLDAEGDADDEGVKGDAHDGAAAFAVAVEDVELVADLLEVFPGSVVGAQEEVDVVEALLVGHDDHAAALHAHGDGLVVEAPVAQVVEAYRRQVIRGVEGFRQGGAEPTPRRLSGGRGDLVPDLPYDGALIGRGIGGQGHIVGDAVAQPLPVPFDALLDDFPLVGADLGIQLGAGPDTVLVEHLHEPEDAHPRAVVAL